MGKSSSAFGSVRRLAAVGIVAAGVATVVPAAAAGPIASAAPGSSSPSNSSPSATAPGASEPGATSGGTAPGATAPNTAAPSSSAPGDGSSSGTESTPPSTSSVPDLDGIPEPSIPMPVHDGALGYVATRPATLWLKDRGVDDVIRNLPVPPAYAESNRGMASNLKRELESAEQTPGACLQIIVDGPGASGGLFDYGFFAVEKQYCPK